jgi:hypothetical protein
VEAAVVEAEAVAVVEEAAVVEVAEAEVAEAEAVGVGAKKPPRSAQMSWPRNRCGSTRLR